MTSVLGEKGEKMARLVDADALKELIANNVYPVQDAFNDRDYGMFWTGGIEKAIDDAPTIDAVEVVRCKNCKWWTKQSDSPQGRCELFHHYPTGGWYCANGRRKNEAG